MEIRGFIIILALINLSFFCTGLSAEQTSFTSGKRLKVPEPQTITLAADHWYPFNGDPMADKPGYMIEVAKKVFEPKGFKINYKVMPWSRAVTEMESGRIDGIVGATQDETEDAVFPLESLALSADTFLVLAESPWRYNGLSSLAAVSLGAVSDYGYEDEIKSYIEQNRGNSKLVQIISSETALEQNIRKLQNKRITALIESSDVFWNKVTELGLNKEAFADAGTDGKKEPLYIAFFPKKKNSKDLAAILDAGIAEIRQNGQLKQILDRYGLVDWK